MDRFGKLSDRDRLMASTFSFVHPEISSDPDALIVDIDFNNEMVSNQHPVCYFDGQKPIQPNLFPLPKIPKAPPRDQTAPPKYKKPDGKKDNNQRYRDREKEKGKSGT